MRYDYRAAVDFLLRKLIEGDFDGMEDVLCMLYDFNDESRCVAHSVIDLLIESTKNRR